MRIKSDKFAVIMTLLLFTSVSLVGQRDENLIVEYPQVSASYIHGPDSLNKFLQSKINYDNLAKDKGKVTIRFVVEKDGSSHSMMMQDSQDSDFAVEASRIISLVPNWNPGEINKKKVRSIHQVKVKFKRPTKYILPELVPIDASSVYDGIGDLQPEFPGGVEAFGKFLHENVNYPDIAMEYNIQGKVYVKCVVQKDGTLAKIQILKGIGYGCDLEALRILSICPPWIPGFQEGKAVNVWYTIPINFQLR